MYAERNKMAEKAFLDRHFIERTPALWVSVTNLVVYGLVQKFYENNASYKREIRYVSKWKV